MVNNSFHVVAARFAETREAVSKLIPDDDYSVFYLERPKEEDIYDFTVALPPKKDLVVYMFLLFLAEARETGDI